MKIPIGASLPEELGKIFTVRAEFFPGGKSGLIKESLRLYFEHNPLTTDEKIKAGVSSVIEVGQTEAD